MGDPRNWTTRKVDQVRRENATHDRARLVEVTLYNHSAAELQDKLGPNFLTLNPCDTFKVFRYTVIAVCVGCGMRWDVKPYELLGDSPWAHRCWPAVMAQAMICPRCTSCPCELRFRSDSAGEVGAVSTHSEVTLHVMGPSRISAPLISRGLPDPGAQYDDGEP